MQCRNKKIHTRLPWLIWFQRVQRLWEEALVNLSLSLSLCVSLAILLSDLNCCCVRACSLGAMQDEILVVVVVVRIVDERIHGNGGFVGQVI